LEQPVQLTEATAVIPFWHRSHLQAAAAAAADYQKPNSDAQAGRAAAAIMEVE